MSPTRRDLFKRFLATIATASVAALPALPVADQPGRLAALIDTSEQVSHGIGTINGMTFIHWAERWSPDEREHYLTVMAREFPDMTADVIDHLEWWARQEEAV